DAARAVPDWSGGRFNGETSACIIVLSAGDSGNGELSDGPGLCWLFDDQDQTAGLYGVEKGPRWFLLDPMMRVLGVEATPRPDRLLDAIDRLPPVGADGMAPVLVLPRLFEPELCQAL